MRVTMTDEGPSFSGFPYNRVPEYIGRDGETFFVLHQLTGPSPTVDFFKLYIGSEGELVEAEITYLTSSPQIRGYKITYDLGGEEGDLILPFIETATSYDSSGRATGMHNLDEKAPGRNTFRGKTTDLETLL